MALPPALEPWQAQLADFAERSRALAIGVFDVDGAVHYLNAGLRDLLGMDEHDPFDPAYFASPRFDALREAESGSRDAPVYSGWLSFGGDHALYRSVFGHVFRRDDELLLLAEYDVDELERVNHELMNVNREITNLQRELARRQAELIQLNERKNEFMGIAAHDLRSPLTVVQGFSSMMLNEPDMPEEERAEFLALILQSAKDMIDLINNLLNISEIESGKLQLNPVDVHLPDYLARVVVLNRHLAEQKDIALDLDLAPDLPLMVFDAERVQQVFNNLLSNAFKFSHPGTHVTIRARLRSEKLVVFSVIDQGQGIPADELNKLFRAFERTSTRSTGGEHSTGLGLAICKKIVEFSGGAITVESTPGEGSTFTFTLPVMPPRD